MYDRTVGLLGIALALLGVTFWGVAIVLGGNTAASEPELVAGFILFGVGLFVFSRAGN
ncbi:MAG: hypothetical protein ACE5KO_02400 [Candidatus Bathyarchaeia archaeon]